MRGRNRTKLEERRFMDIQERGCVPCFIEARLQQREWIPEPCDIHHTVGGNNHLATYGNCPWHHRGIRKNDASAIWMREVFGPSKVREPREYRLRYGSETELLQLQNRMLVASVEQLKEGNENVSSETP